MEKINQKNKNLFLIDVEEKFPERRTMILDTNDDIETVKNDLTNPYCEVKNIVETSLETLDDDFNEMTARLLQEGFIDSQDTEGSSSVH